MKELIEDYKRRIETLANDLRLYKSTGSINDIKKVERLTTKLFEYRAFVVDLERVQGQNVPESYFQIVHSGYQTGIEREEIQVHGGKNANIFLIKTDEGFVIDVYGQNDLIDTMAIFEDTLNEDDLTDVEEETNAPENFSDLEVTEFKQKWGQMHNEVCRELGYPLPHVASDELLMVDFFWIEKDRKWYNKCASLFTAREQAIADFLRNSN